ncbi:hypothetical protein MPSEU_000901900 [Mayamaea pseudoterrestris]|nr:hypothetical protein MPSEU_000901900 [Mayamaea pseudoterrestris]
MRASTLLLLVSLDTMAALVVGLAIITPTAAFSATFSIPVTRPKHSMALHARTRSRGANEDQGAEGMDQVRQKLEALLLSSDTALTRQESTNSNKAMAQSGMLRDKTMVLQQDPIDFHTDLSTQPPLTSIDRERRTAEIQLLANLESGDEGLSDLWAHWFQERGAAAAARLLRAEELTGQGPKSWNEAERVLRDLIKDYGVYWAEPVNRLATLYYMQGKLRESESLSKIVLKVKPWHFGALSGIVMVCAGLRDAESARMWAARRMPTFAPKGPNRRRTKWVERSVREAENFLADAEMRLTKSFGKPDQRRELQLHDEDAWQ